MCRECVWEDVLEEIEDVLCGGNAEWARDTLEGIADTIERNEHATDRQIQAVANIEEAVSRRA